MGILTKSAYKPMSLSKALWTPSARECYLRGGQCQGCFYLKFFEGLKDKCQMKQTVLYLVRELGVPKNLKRNSDDLLLEESEPNV